MVSDEICLQCGDKGFANAFIYCTKCLQYVVHRYCLNVIPKTLDEFVPWVCDFCQDETLSSGLKNDPKAYEFSHNETKGVMDLKLVHENGFKESVAESCLDSIDKVRSRSITGDGLCQDETLTGGQKNDPMAYEFSHNEPKRVVDLKLLTENGSKESEKCEQRADGIEEAQRSDLNASRNDGNDENNMPMIVIKPETCVHEKVVNEKGFNEESAIVSRDIIKEKAGSKTNARPESLGKSADSGCSFKHSQILSSPLKRNKRIHLEFWKEKHYGSRDSWEKSREDKHVKWNAAAGEYSSRLESSSKVHTKLREGRFERTNRPYVYRKPTNDPIIMPLELSTISNDLPLASTAEKRVIVHHRMTQVEEPTDSSSAAPVAKPVWRGFFEIPGRSQIITGVSSHISSKACQKVHDAVVKFLPVLSMAMLPKMDVWPKSFKSRRPNGDNIALFFFPSRKSGRAFYDLIHHMLNENLALKSSIPGADLLIFTSKELPHPYSNFQGNTYLWGVFREGQRSNSSSPAAVEHRNKCNSYSRGRGDSRNWRFPYPKRRFLPKLS